MWVQSLSWEDPLEEGMATHSSILAWRIQWGVFLPGESNGEYSCLENPMDRGAWQATVHEIAERWTLQKQLSTNTRTHIQ